MLIGGVGRSHALRGLVLACCLAVSTCGGPAAPSPPDPAVCTPAPGTVCFGRLNFVEYAAGDLPIVVSVPHGGALAPASIPTRTIGTTVTDSNTIDLVRTIEQAFLARTGRAPYLVICHLRRTKLDANREIAEATQGNAEATQSWTEYHNFVDTAVRDVRARHGRGVYIDLHGHGHATARLELGYLLSNATLDLSDAELDAGGFAEGSSLAAAMPFTPARFSELLRGPTSLGGLLLPRLPSVPSPETPTPGPDPYFDGGYSTSRHTTAMPGLQIETHFPGVRDSAANRAAFAETLASAVADFARIHLGLGW